MTHTLAKMLKISRSAARSLLQHKLRSALSILGVVCGVMAVLSMISIGEGAKKKVVRQIEQLGVRNIYIRAIELTPAQQRKAREQLSQGLNIDDASRINHLGEAIRFSAHLLEVVATIIGIEREVMPQVVAVSPAYASVQRFRLRQGRFISAIDIDRKQLVCVLGFDTARQLGGRGQIGKFLRMEDQLFKIVGILDRFDLRTESSTAVSVRNHNQMLFIPFGVHTLFGRPATKGTQQPRPSSLSEIVFQVKRSDDVLKTAEVVRRVMAANHHGVDDYQIVVPLELLNQARKTQRIFNFVLGAIAGVSLLVGGIGIMNIMLATVSERTREIGIRRAVGATRGDIIFQFLIESVILTICGGLIGIFCGTICVWVIAEIALWDAAMTPLSIVLPLAMSVMVGIFFGLYPAYQAARLDPAAAFRHD